MTQSEINESWSAGAANYDEIIHDEMNSFRLEKWLERIMAQVPSEAQSSGCRLRPRFFHHDTFKVRSRRHRY